MSIKRTQATRKKRKTSSAKESEGANAFDLSNEQISILEKDYEDKFGQFQSLLDEIVFILSERIKVSKIKIHGIEQRIKASQSAIEKCKVKGATKLEGLSDIVGARIICLFRSDMDRVGELIRSNFDVQGVDDKISVENNPLGYLSVHYICRMPPRYKGPRYENTGKISFEIQVRTLCMHAWAAVSHYLDYKGEWDVPADLKRALSALSGLFYVADSEFEQFYSARLQSQKAAEEQRPHARGQEINLDTVTAYLGGKFLDRKVVKGDIAESAEIVSRFVRELKGAGYKNIEEVDHDIDRVMGEFSKQEIKRHGSEFYSGVGFSRGCLRLASKKFAGISSKKTLPLVSRKK